MRGWVGKDGYQRQSHVRRTLGPRRTTRCSCGGSSGLPVFLHPSSPASTLEQLWVCHPAGHTPASWFVPTHRHSRLYQEPVFPFQDD